MSGAAEHSYYMGKGCVANINIGLTGRAVKGAKWRTHRRNLLDIFVTALTFAYSDTIGLLLSEVGSVVDPYEDDDKGQIDLLFKEAFYLCFKTFAQRSGAS